MFRIKVIIDAIYWYFSQQFPLKLDFSQELQEL